MATKRSRGSSRNGWNRRERWLPSRSAHRRAEGPAQARGRQRAGRTGRGLAEIPKVRQVVVSVGQVPPERQRDQRFAHAGPAARRREVREAEVSERPRGGRVEPPPWRPEAARPQAGGRV